MRVYMLPITITATLMSAHIALADRAHQAPARPAAQVQADAIGGSKEHKARRVES